MLEVIRPNPVAQRRSIQHENIRQIAKEANLGLESIVFIDDNPAEIDIVKQFIPDVKTVLLDMDCAEYTQAIKDSRLFETLGF